MTELDDFLLAVDPHVNSAVDRAIAILWRIGLEGPEVGATSKEICEIIHRNGFPQQNYSRLDAQLAEQKEFVSRISKTKAWKVHPRGRLRLNARFEAFTQRSATLPPSDSVLARTLVENSRGYIEKVVRQINASYDAELFDCCAVMCRRLVETLIIEVYEHVGRAADIKGSDGHFLMLNDLLRTLSKDPQFSLSRNTLRGLEEFKKLGDQSAHNRRFNAQKADIDRTRDGLRVSIEELLHLARLI